MYSKNVKYTTFDYCVNFDFLLDKIIIENKPSIVIKIDNIDIKHTDSSIYKYAIGIIIDYNESDYIEKLSAIIPFSNIIEKSSKYIKLDKNIKNVNFTSIIYRKKKYIDNIPHCITNRIIGQEIICYDLEKLHSYEKVKNIQKYILHISLINDNN